MAVWLFVGSGRGKRGLVGADASGGVVVRAGRVKNEEARGGDWVVVVIFSGGHLLGRLVSGRGNINGGRREQFGGCWLFSVKDEAARGGKMTKEKSPTAMEKKDKRERTDGDRKWRRRRAAIFFSGCWSEK
ncbi:hypothetical protein HAX54_013998 [Datura stramonium]|uniref:Uncharacterized protein n=1 Tax=Datura stramonium TaxID=4076 RepID=A0ABS8TPC4_DATST|nr:hypothetical protein [Datura stramonium]